MTTSAYVRVRGKRLKAVKWTWTIGFETTDGFQLPVIPHYARKVKTIRR